jgi:cell division transport system permease protein
MSNEIRGAALQKASVGSRLTHWRHHHAEEAASSLKRMRATPLSTFMTLLVIGIALSLPLGLAKLLEDARHLVQGWSGNAQISLYLQKDLPAKDQNDLRQQLQDHAGVQRVDLITPAQALQEFKADSGYGEAIDLLGSNPLPPTIMVYPADNDPIALENLRGDLEGLPGVASAELDVAWVQRLSAILQVADRLVLAMASALTAAVLLVVGNTIRLGIESRREEIVVIKLLGASDAFVRRPFLYMGLWSGLFGGVLALVAVALFIFWLSFPVNRLATLYHSGFHLSGLSLGEVAGVLAFSCLLGLAGATMAVGRHLRQLEPG